MKTNPNTYLSFILQSEILANTQKKKKQIDYWPSKRKHYSYNNHHTFTLNTKLLKKTTGMVFADVYMKTKCFQEVNQNFAKKNSHTMSRNVVIAITVTNSFDPQFSNEVRSK